MCSVGPRTSFHKKFTKKFFELKIFASWKFCNLPINLIKFT